VNEDKKTTEKTLTVKSEVGDELDDIDAQYAPIPEDSVESLLDDDENFLESSWEGGRALSSISDKISAVLFGQSDKLAL